MADPTLAFRARARTGIGNPDLQRALAKLKGDFRAKRAIAVDRLPEFEALRDEARAIKEHTLDHLDLYLERFSQAVADAGGTVHWCDTPGDARAAITAICRTAGARTVTKGKSMIGEEIALNDALAEAGMVPVETDLGEYIIQLRHEPPSHITAPAVHLTKDQVSQAFLAAHVDRPADRPLSEPRDLLDEAREVLRGSFLKADVGITGANFLVAETGSAVIVTNEGNGDLTQTVPRVHIVIATIEKLVPTLADAMTLVRVLARSATAQEITSYTTFATGPKRPGDADGPDAFHVVLLDGGRSALLDGPFREVLRCIRCGACQSLCPVYGAIGGHAYAAVYAGPIGAVLTPALGGLESSHHLAEASSFCGTCEAVCPMRIPLPGLMRRWREAAFTRRIGSPRARLALAVWGFFARRPAFYRAAAWAAIGALAAAGRRRGGFARLPLAGGWTASRDFPAPEGGTFIDRWQRGERGPRT